jgi:hypothetical protein
MSSESSRGGDPLRALIAKWRQSCDAVRREMVPGGIREKYPEGPRYGIAAVESCADELEALLAASVASAEEEEENKQP